MLNGEVLRSGMRFTCAMTLLASLVACDWSDRSMEDTSASPNVVSTASSQEWPQQTAHETSSGQIYAFTLEDIDGRPVPLGQYRGKVLLIVNTASRCGYTPQYEHLQELYTRYRDKGLEVLAFPANNFGGQEPGTNKQIARFCYTKYSVSFPLFSKISVRGQDKHPLYTYLTEQSPFPGEVRWNFQKYLVDRSGTVVARYRSSLVPLSDEIVQNIEEALAKVG